MDGIAFFYYSIKYFDEGKQYEKPRENLRNYGEQALAYSDIGAERGEDNLLFLVDYLITSTDPIFWKKKTGRSASLDKASHPYWVLLFPMQDII